MKRSWLSGSVLERAAGRWLQKEDRPDARPLDIFRCLSEARNILIAPNDRVGGPFLAGPVYKLLRQHYKDARLSLVVDSRWASVAHGIPYIDTVVAADLSKPVWSASFRAAQQTLRAAEYDLVFCLGVDCSFRLACLCTYSGARMRVGFDRPRWTLPPFNVQIALSNPERYESEQYRRMLQMLGIRGDSTVRWALDEDKVEQMHARHLADSTSNRRIIALDLSRGEGTGLAPQQAEEIVGRVVERGARALLFHTAAEGKRVSALTSTYGTHVIPFKGEDLASTGLLLPSCQALIACNTDLLHMAMALQIPVVALFAEDPQRWANHGNHQIKVIQDRTVATISVSQVGRALDEILSDTQRYSATARRR